MVSDLVPLVIGILASPFPVIPVILLLLTPRATANAVSFLGGWAAGVAAGTALFVGLATVIDGFEETPTWVSWARVLLGGVLVVVGVDLIEPDIVHPLDDETERLDEFTVTDPI